MCFAASQLLSRCTFTPTVRTTFGYFALILPPLLRVLFTPPLGALLYPGLKLPRIPHVPFATADRSALLCLRTPTLFPHIPFPSPGRSALMCRKAPTVLFWTQPLIALHCAALRCLLTPSLPPCKGFPSPGCSGLRSRDTSHVLFSTTTGLTALVIYPYTPTCHPCICSIVFSVIILISDCLSNYLVPGIAFLLWSLCCALPLSSPLPHVLISHQLLIVLLSTALCIALTPPPCTNVPPATDCSALNCSSCCSHPSAMYVLFPILPGHYY